MSCNHKEDLNELVNAVKESSRLFAKTATYLRKRSRSCPGRQSFDKGVKIMDTALEKVLEQGKKTLHN